jgi:hypothetical protein
MPEPPRRHDVTITVDLEVATFEPGRSRRGGTADGVSQGCQHHERAYAQPDHQQPNVSSSPQLPPLE